MGTSISNLAFDELSQWSLSQFRRGTFRDVKRRRNHLAGGSVQADKMDEAWEFLQVSEISQVKVSTLWTTVCFSSVDADPYNMHAPLDTLQIWIIHNMTSQDMTPW